MTFNSAMIWLKAVLFEVEPVDWAKAPLATDIKSKKANMPPTIAVQTFTAPFATCSVENGEDGLLGLGALGATDRRDVFGAGIKVQRYEMSISKYLLSDNCVDINIPAMQGSSGCEKAKRVENRVRYAGAHG